MRPTVRSGGGIDLLQRESLLVPSGSFILSIAGSEAENCNDSSRTLNDDRSAITQHFGGRTLAADLRTLVPDADYCIRAEFSRVL